MPFRLKPSYEVKTGASVFHEQHKNGMTDIRTRYAGVLTIHHFLAFSKLALRNGREELGKEVPLLRVFRAFISQKRLVLRAENVLFRYEYMWPATQFSA